MSPGERKQLAQPEAGLCVTLLPGLRSVLAENPSPMTGPGTTTYLLGEGEVTVIDPGPAGPGHLQAILAALAPGEQITAILVTHPHLDHSALAPALAAATGAPVYGFGAAGTARSALMAHLAAQGLRGPEGVDQAFRPDILLRDGEILKTTAGPLIALHTPGHMAEHLCFGWQGQLFCGDLIMAWAPSLVSPPEGDMGDYMASLQRLQGQGWQRLFPAHGAVIDDPASRIAELLAHRLAREAQILTALAGLGQGDLNAILPLVYATTPEALWPAAKRNLLAHLAELVARGRVEAEDWPSEYARFRRR